MIWEARVLDCWRLILGVDADSDLLSHSDELAENNCLLTLQDLLDHACVVRQRYTSQAAYEQSLSTEDYNVADPASRAPKGSPWGRACAPPEPQPGATDSEPDMVGAHDSPDGSEHDSNSEPLDVDEGSQCNAEADLPGLMDIPDDISPADNVEPLESDRGTPSPEIPPPPKPKSAHDDGPKVHTELPGFDGDRVISNAILFSWSSDGG
ncbi:hypothetical protein DFH09DRAFT_1322530 [Mycena vulgaris]|nr:hypothetical protein DFH09DRAFT_1322530 [Mycena vulgaris]